MDKSLSPNATPEQLLRLLTTCFYSSSCNGLKWSYHEGVFLRRLFGREVEEQFKKFWEED